MKGFASSRQNPSLREKTLLQDSFVHVFAHRFGHEKRRHPDPKGRGKWVVPTPQVDPHEKASHLSDFNFLAQEMGGCSLSCATHLPRPFGSFTLSRATHLPRPFGSRDGENADSGRKRKLRSTEAGDAGSESLHSMVPLTWENAIVCGIFASLSPSVRPACPVSCFSIFVSVQKAPNPRHGRTRDDGRIRPKGYLAKQTGAVANGFAKQAAVARCKRLCKARCRRFTSR